MRYYIIFGVTALLLILIFLYNPNSKYLGIYNKEANIKYDLNEEGYEWKYETNCKYLNIKSIEKDHWLLQAKNNESCNMTFNYINNETNEISCSIYYEFLIKKNKIYWTKGSALGLLDYPNPY